MAQTLYGQTREQWTEQAAKALLASVDPPLLRHIVATGFRPFAALARREFRREEPGIRFSTDELRAMFEYLQMHARRLM